MSDPSCQCEDCVNCCKTNPGWMTPVEAMAAMDAGLANRLMRDWLATTEDVEGVEVLAPASVGCEGEDAPDFNIFDMFLIAVFDAPFYKGRCNFLTEDNKCEIHDSGFKPIQCRTSLGCSDERGEWSNYKTADLWRTEEGAAAIKRWEELNTREGNHDGSV